MKSIAKFLSKAHTEKSKDPQSSSKTFKDKTQGPGDCLWKGGAEEIISRLPPDHPKYISFYCGNRWKDEEIIHKRFTIWIPEKLLKKTKDSFKKGRKINIKTRTCNITDVSEKLDFYITTFDCVSFSETPIKGKWGGSVLLGEDWIPADLDYQVYIVKIIEPKMGDNVIYLRMEDF